MLLGRTIKVNKQEIEHAVIARVHRRLLDRGELAGVDLVDFLHQVEATWTAEGDLVLVTQEGGRGE